MKAYKKDFCRAWVRLQAGLCPRQLCAQWSYNPETGESCCGLRYLAPYEQLREGRGLCTRDPAFRGSGPLPDGSVAGFDFFMLRWCDDCWNLLPRRFRDYFFPTPFDRKGWRRELYERGEKGRTRALKRFRPAPST